jgi:hypothetical protein
VGDADGEPLGASDAPGACDSLDGDGLGDLEAEGDGERLGLGVGDRVAVAVYPVGLGCAVGLAPGCADPDEAGSGRTQM